MSKCVIQTVITMKTHIETEQCSAIFMIDNNAAAYDEGLFVVPLLNVMSMDGVRWLSLDFAGSRDDTGLY